MSVGKAPLRLRSALSLAVALMWILLLPQVATASIVIANHMEGSIADATPGPRLYAYDQGQNARFDLASDFDQGTYVDTEVDTTGTFLQLASAVSVPWWNTDWGSRQCFEVTNPSATALTEHQVRLTFDTSAELLAGKVQADGSDLRAIAADDTTELDIWVEAGVGTVETVVWVQLDLAATATTKLCLYFNNEVAPSVSSPSDVFSYDTPRQLYYPLYWTFNGGTNAAGQLDIVSFVDDNSVTVDGATEVIDAGQSALFTQVDEDSVITVTGPISGRGRGGGMDAIVPISFAGTDMVFPTNRSSQRWTLVSPSGDNADVEIYNGTALAWTGTVGGTAVVADADVGGGRSGVIRSTNGVPIIVTHASAQNSLADSLVVPPFFPGDDIYGVRSRGAWYGFDTAGSVDIFRSDGTIQTLTGAAGSVTLVNDAQDLDGDGTAVRLTNMTTATGGLQQADRDGFESTSFLPERLLESEYYLPSAAQYITFACPTSMSIDVGGTEVLCNSFSPDAPGHGWFGAAPQGTRLTSTTGMPFFAYYEDQRNNDETNLFGMKSAQSFPPEPLTVVGAATEDLAQAPSTGTWTSPPIDTTSDGSNVFGLMTTLASLPANTDVSVQVARGSTEALALVAPFVGPDGTGATSFEPGEVPAPFDWDFDDQYVVTQITLSTTTAGVSPLVDAIGVGYDLPEVSLSSSHLVETNGSTPDRDWLLRIWTEDPVLAAADAVAFLQSSSGLGAAAEATVSIDDGGSVGSDQVVIAGGAPVVTLGSPVTIGPALPHNLMVDHTAMVGAQLRLVWQAVLDGSSILIPHRLEVSFG